MFTLVLTFVWLVWSGLTLQIHRHDGTFSLEVETMLVGFAVGSIAFTVWLSSRMGAPDEETAPFHLTGRAFVYLPYLVKEIILSNLHVAEVILRRDLPIHPKLIRVPCSQKTDLGQVIYANSITITPGTVSLDVRGDTILVHALTNDTAEGVMSGEMDAMVTWLEGGGA